LRFSALLFAAIAVTFSAPAFAAWQGYENEELGYSVSFPGEPSEGTGIYRSDLAFDAPTHYTRLVDGDAVYSVTVIDTGRVDEGAIVINEFEYWLGHFGDISLNTVSRLNTGMEYGRFINIDCRDGVLSDGPNQTERAHRIFMEAGEISCPDGARLTANIFFTQGRLYAVIAVLAGPNARTSGAPSRFANSLGWIGANAEHAEGLIDWDARAAALDIERE
jgi:hypothetical protein